jgi:hypothetical protein
VSLCLLPVTNILNIFSISMWSTRRNIFDSSRLAYDLSFSFSA